MSFIAQCFTSLVKGDHFITLVRLLLLQPVPFWAVVAVAIVTATPGDCGARREGAGLGYATLEALMVASLAMKIPRSPGHLLPTAQTPLVSLNSPSSCGSRSSPVSAVPQLTPNTLILLGGSVGESGQAPSMGEVLLRSTAPVSAPAFLESRAEPG